MRQAFCWVVDEAGVLCDSGEGRVCGGVCGGRVSNGSWGGFVLIVVSGVGRTKGAGVCGRVVLW